MAMLDCIMTTGTSSSTSHIVGEAGAGIRLDRFLASRIETLSRARLQDLIRAGQVTANGRPVTDPSVKVRAGESFEVEVPPVEPYTLAGEQIALTVVYEDDSLIVIEGAASVIAGGRTLSLARGGSALVPAALPYSIAARSPRAILFKAGVPERTYT